MQASQIVISGTGLYSPPSVVSNDELVAAFNVYVDAENAKHADAIARGERKPHERSSAELIETLRHIVLSDAFDLFTLTDDRAFSIEDDDV